MATHIEKEIAGLKKQLTTREGNLIKLKQSSIFVQSTNKNDEITLEVAMLEKRLKSFSDDRNNCIRARAAQHEEMVKHLSSLNVKHGEVIEGVAEECRAKTGASNDFLHSYVNTHRVATSMLRMTNINEELALELTKLRQLISEVAENKCLRQKYLDLLQSSKTGTDKIPSAVNIVRPKAKKISVLEKKRQIVNALQSELDVTF
uniref:CCDC92 domain-containing protein n=1 Tax=Panagrellus redivivus TaxID=6233 RepID=A0A7E4ZU51_PANRE